MKFLPHSTVPAYHESAHTAVNRRYGVRDTKWHRHCSYAGATTKPQGSHNYIQAIVDLLSQIEAQQKKCKASVVLGFSEKAIKLRAIVASLLVEAFEGADAGPWFPDAAVPWYAKLYMNLSEIVKDHAEQVWELVTISAGLQGQSRGSGSTDEEQVLEASRFVGTSFMNACEKLLAEVRIRQRIASFVIILEL